MESKLIDKMKAIGYSQRDALVFVRAKGCCEYCGVDLVHNRIAWDAAQFDHVIPKSKSGSDDESNLALSCKVCNNAKMTFVPEGDDRSARIKSAQLHISSRREHANEYWKTVSNMFREHFKV